MKYKLIKSFPGFDEVGTIFIPCLDCARYVSSAPSKCLFLKNKEIESSPEFFAPYLFTDELGNEIYQGDDYYAVVLKDYPNGGCAKGDILSKDMLIGYVTIATSIIDKNVNDGYWKMFSTRESAQSYIDSINKPIFKTEDGVDIYDGDKFYWCRTFEESEALTDPIGRYGLYESSANTRNISSLYKWFSTEQAACNWINKQNELPVNNDSIIPYLEELFKGVSQTKIGHIIIHIQKIKESFPFEEVTTLLQDVQSYLRGIKDE